MTEPTPNDRFDAHLRRVVQDTRSAVPEQQRLGRLLREFRALHARPSFLQRLATWLGEAHRLPAPAIALAAVVIVAQGIALVSLMPDRQAAEQWRSAAITRCEDGPRIRAVFKPEAPHAEVVILLRKVEATVAEGPTETGEFWLTVPKGRNFDEALAQLKSSSLVDEAIRVEPSQRGCAR